MPATLGGTHTEAPSAPEQQQRLARVIGDLIPSASVVRVHQRGPRHAWPHPYAHAVTAAGLPIRLTRVQATTAARWVQRTATGLGLEAGSYELDVAAGRLIAAGAERGR